MKKMSRAAMTRRETAAERHTAPKRKSPSRSSATLGRSRRPRCGATGAAGGVGEGEGQVVGEVGLLDALGGCVGALQAADHELAGLVLDAAVLDLLLVLGVGQLDVADAALGLRHQAGDAVTLVLAIAKRPVG